VRVFLIVIVLDEMCLQSYIPEVEGRREAEILGGGALPKSFTLRSASQIIRGNTHYRTLFFKESVGANVPVMTHEPQSLSL